MMTIATKHKLVAATAVAIMATTMSAAQGQDRCAVYLGQKIAPITIDAAISRFATLTPKGEFETTAQYEARKARAIGSTSGPFVISKAPEDRKYLEYDADAGKLRISRFAFQNSAFNAWKTFFNAGVDKAIDVDIYANYDVVISQVDVPTGVYTGSNSFGAKTKVVKINRVTKAIFDRKAPGILDDDLFIAGTKEPYAVGELSVPPERAKVLKQTIKMAYVVEPKEPFLVRSSYNGHEPTIQVPTDVTEVVSVLIADIQCGLVTDATNTVLGAYPTN